MHFEDTSPLVRRFLWLSHFHEKETVEDCRILGVYWRSRGEGSWLNLYLLGDLRLDGVRSFWFMSAAGDLACFAYTKGTGGA